MIWRSHVLLFVFLLIGTSLSKSLEESHGLNDDKVSSSISHLLKSLETPSEPPAPHTQIITKHGIISARPGRTPNARKLFFGELHDQSVASGVPKPVVVSSQAITISGGSNGTGGNKRGRSLNASPVDKDGVRTIEGVRVPDDEHDKFYTWRNARVIKNFLVPNNRPANPQRKRQILIQDARQYLSGASQQQGQQQGVPQQAATATVIDASSLSQQQPQTAQIYYAQTQPQTSHHSQTTILQGQDLTAALYAAASAQQQQLVGGGGQVYQYPNGQQATAFSYTPQQGQMYVLQPDGKTYLPYNPTQLPTAPADQTHHHYQPPQQTQQQYQQTQFASRSGEVDSSSSAEHPQPNYQQAAAAIQRLQQQYQLQQLKKQQQEQEYKQHILSKHQSHLQQQQESQQQQIHPQVSITPLSGQGTVSSPNPSATPALLHKSSQQNVASIAATALPTGTSIGQQLQEQVAMQSQHFVAQTAAAQHHPNGQVVPISGPVYHIPQQQQAQPAILEERNGNSGGNIIGGPQPVSPSQFVIQPQTYLSGGQMFTVPVPIPADQFQSGSEQHEHHHQQQSHSKDRHRDRDGEHNNKNKQDGKQGTYANRLMESLQINRKAMERIDTTGVVVPILTTAGIFLGFGALAAGWYLSKSNREVGILRRTGKPAGSAASQSALSASLLAGSTKSAQDKDHAIVAHLRRRRNTDGEVDQASFFQSIIQHGIEKQQVKYEDPEPNRRQNYYSGVANNNNNVRSDQVQIKPMSYNSNYNSNSNQNQNQNQNQNSNSQQNHNSDNSKITRSDRDDTDRHGKGGKGGGHISKVKTFAKVAIPAIILGGSVVIIGALIFGWYVSGKNREIAFLEPSAYSRRKRSLIDNVVAQNSDGWLHRTLTSIHTNPYETEAPLTHPLLEKKLDTRKSTPFITDSDLTNVAVALSMAAFAFGSLTVLALAWYFTDNTREVGWADNGPYTFGHWPTNYIGKHPRVHRSITTNDMTLDSPSQNSGFLHKILDNLEVSQSSLLNKLQESGSYDKWQETPCAKRIFCDIMSTQGDDTIRIMEKRMTKFLTMLPDSLSSSLAQTLGDVMMSINRKDCSAYTCGGQLYMDSQSQPSVPAYSPRR